MKVTTDSTNYVQRRVVGRKLSRKIIPSLFTCASIATSLLQSKQYVKNIPLYAAIAKIVGYCIQGRRSAVKIIMPGKNKNK